MRLIFEQRGVLHMILETIILYFYLAQHVECVDHILITSIILCVKLYVYVLSYNWND